MVEWSWIRAAMDLGEKVGGWNFGEEEALACFERNC
jgi:hypothetical protein